MRHIISALDLTSNNLKELFERTRHFKRSRHIQSTLLSGKFYASLFYEPSTRTRFSLEIAAKRLGADGVSTENAHEFSSAAKGETLEDTLAVVSKMVEIIFVRHTESGKLLQASQHSYVPVINAGDGANEHPTQAFLDLYTIYECLECGRLPTRPLRIQFFGDNLKSRTVRSLAKLLAIHTSALNIPIERMDFGGPDDSNPDTKLTTFLLEQGIKCNFIGDTPRPRTDVLYVTRPQIERDDKAIRGPYPARCRITLAIAEQMPMESIIMHPLPRTEELTTDTDRDRRAYYFEQAENGLYVRMALLEMLLAKN